MGFLKWLDNHVRQSNENWHQGYVESERKRKIEEAQKCCANCLWFSRFDCGYGPYHCSKLNFNFDYDKANREKIHHTKTCRYFYKK